MRLVGAPTPSPEGKRKDRNAGDPLAQSRKQGPMFFLLNVTHSPEQATRMNGRRWAKLRHMSLPHKGPQGGGNRVARTFANSRDVRTDPLPQLRVHGFPIIRGRTGEYCSVRQNEPTATNSNVRPMILNGLPHP